MPNWKTYESSVRLLSAIIAAHPGLKLDYGEVARFYGDNSVYKSVWDRMNTISKHAKNLTAAVEAGQDPFTVPLIDSKGYSRTKAISDRFGGDCTQSAIDNRFRRIKSDAKMINEAIKRGIDPITLEIGTITYREAGHAKTKKPDASSTAPHKMDFSKVFDKVIRSNIKALFARLDASGDCKDAVINPVLTFVIEMAKYFGSDCNKKAMLNVMSRNVKSDVKRLKDALAAGKDPKDIDFSEFTWGAEIIKHMGDDVTAGGISWQISQRIRPIGQRQSAMRNAGLDPANIDLDAVKPTKGGNGQEFHPYTFHCVAKFVLLKNTPKSTH
ncbi:hypothetical protein BGZ60DRAFT_386768 [Tricladium varicosporioides]|nr:hypothetical protein BGZ60DRAFT_386768 [Hymenoscyphus varicosporioides]